MSGVVQPSNRYLKPAGYKTYIARGASRYKPFNGYVSGGDSYGPRQVTAATDTIAFSAAPTNLATLTIPDGATNNAAVKSFVFTYSGSPGALVIPLVAGGGTAAQAATATQVALAAQLTNWVVTLASATSVLLTSKQAGINPIIVTSDVVHISIAPSASSIGNVHPGKAGNVYCTLNG